mmetsp:Transcript_43379/g.114248  ORF Transcript_43379/g.114248 Transcript_43379/m.114248 type:complete len:209 (-) Transcript_43379:5501-6127(-)
MFSVVRQTRSLLRSRRMEFWTLNGKRTLRRFSAPSRTSIFKNSTDCPSRSQISVPMLRTRSRTRLSAPKRVSTMQQVLPLSLMKMTRTTRRATGSARLVRRVTTMTTMGVRWMMTRTSVEFMWRLSKKMRRKRRRRRQSTWSIFRRSMPIGFSVSWARSFMIRTSVLRLRRKFCRFCRSKTCSNARTDLSKCCSMKTSNSRSCSLRTD